MTKKLEIENCITLFMDVFDHLEHYFQHAKQQSGPVMWQLGNDCL